RPADALGHRLHRLAPGAAAFACDALHTRLRKRGLPAGVGHWCVLVVTCRSSSCVAGDATAGMLARVASVADDLKQVPLFSGLSQRHLRQLAKDFHERRVRQGVELMKQGEMSGVDCFVIVEGEAAVKVDGVEVARLGPGDYFGE